MTNSLSHLFTPLQMGRMSLPNRIVMSPMTRYRANEDGIPDDYNRLYYQQRASAAFVVSESNYFDPTGRLAPLATGLYSPEQIAAWRKVTQDVHDIGGRMFAQLVHCGRVSHPSLQPGGALPYAPSPIKQTDLVRLKTGKVEPHTPRALETAEIHKVSRDSPALSARQSGQDLTVRNCTPEVDSCIISSCPPIQIGEAITTGGQQRTDAALYWKPSKR